MTKIAHLSPVVEQPSSARAGPLVAYGTALAMVALSTLAGKFLATRWANSAVDLLYVPTILAAATWFGLWPALVAGLASALAYNFFFTPPFHTLQMDRPADIVTVVILFLVATVTSKLAANVREQAELARAHANRNGTVAGFAARLLSCSGKQEVASVACNELARIFGCNVVMAEGLPRPDVLASEPPTVPITPSDFGTAAAVLQFGEAAGRGAARPYPTDWQFHPVRSGEAVLVAVGLVRDDDVVAVQEDRRELLESLLDQVALALERARVEREARDFVTLAERDRVRSSLLSSIGRDLRPAIAAIASAARDVRRTPDRAKEAAAVIGAETSKVERYLSNLVELDLDSDQQPIEVGAVTVDLVQRRVSRSGDEVHLTPKEYAVLAELAKHRGRVLTHSHLLRSAWGPAQEHQTEYLRVAIRSLRQKLERDPARPAIIINEPTVGYRLMG